MEQCEQIGLLLGPVLETRRRDERPLPSKILESLQNGCAKLFGPRHLPLKVGAALSLVLLIWLSLATAPFRISSDSVLEAEIRRSIVAPQEGYIAASHVRAGDLVQEGDLLVTLDDQELRLEQRKWQSQRAQLLKEYRKALAGLDRAEVAILNAKRAQAESQLRLVEQQLARTTLVAPFSGLIVKGDLSQDLLTFSRRQVAQPQLIDLGERRRTEALRIAQPHTTGLDTQPGKYRQAQILLDHQIANAILAAPLYLAGVSGVAIFNMDGGGRAKSSSVPPSQSPFQRSTVARRMPGSGPPTPSAS